jgi:hypothetical protein
MLATRAQRASDAEIAVSARGSGGMSESDVPGAGELPVLQRAYDLCRDTVPAIHESPKAFRFTLGERLEGGRLDLVLHLREARFREGRAAALLSADRAVRGATAPA